MGNFQTNNQSNKQSIEENYQEKETFDKFAELDMKAVGISFDSADQNIEQNIPTDSVVCSLCSTVIKKKNYSRHLGSLKHISNEIDYEESLKKEAELKEQKLGVVRIKRCTGASPEFDKMIPDSKHNIVEPPKGYHNDSKGVWVMGITEKVRLLTHEFYMIES